jgi:hypothetical protein
MPRLGHKKSVLVPHNHPTTISKSIIPTPCTPVCTRLMYTSCLTHFWQIKIGLQTVQGSSRQGRLYTRHAEGICKEVKTDFGQCDELKPCTNCARHGMPCSLVTWEPNAPHIQPLEPASSTSNASRRTDHSPAESSKAVRL